MNCCGWTRVLACAPPDPCTPIFQRFAHQSCTFLGTAKIFREFLVVLCLRRVFLHIFLRFRACYRQQKCLALCGSKLTHFTARPQKVGVHLQLAQPPPWFFWYCQRYVPLTLLHICPPFHSRKRRRCRSSSAWKTYGGALAGVVCRDEGTQGRGAAASERLF